MILRGHGRACGLVVLLAVGLGALSLVLDSTVQTWFAAGRDPGLVARIAASELVGSGTVWGGLPVLAGWLVRDSALAAVAGLVAGETALATYAVAGLVIGAHGSGIWASDAPWFALTVVAGPVLGFFGALARRRDVWGLLARLVVPAAAVSEPVARGMLVSSGPPGNPVDLASSFCGAVLVLLGAAAAWWVLRTWSRERAT